MLQNGGLILEIKDVRIHQRKHEIHSWQEFKKMMVDNFFLVIIMKYYVIQVTKIYKKILA